MVHEYYLILPLYTQLAIVTILIGATHSLITFLFNHSCPTFRFFLIHTYMIQFYIVVRHMRTCPLYIYYIGFSHSDTFILAHKITTNDCASPYLYIPIFFLSFLPRFALRLTQAKIPKQDDCDAKCSFWLSMSTVCSSSSTSSSWLQVQQ